MADIIVRDWLTDQLKPLLPKGWKVVDTQRSVGTLSTTTVLLKQQSISRLPEAPQGARIVEYLLTVATDTTSEKTLDDQVITLLNALDDIGDQLRWTKADKVVFADQYPAYDITIQIPYSHSKE